MAKRAVDVTRLKRLYNRLRRAGGRPTPPPPADATDEAVLALLLGATTEQRAAASLRRLKRSFVDYNEIRVTRLSEIEEAISPLPDAGRKAQAISLMLNAVFDRHHRASIEPVFELPKREARKFLERISSPAAAARVLLMSQGAHAVPADDAVRRTLIAERVTDAGVTVGKLQTALERHLKAGEAYSFYRLVRDLADSQTAKAAARKKTARRKVTRKKAAAKKTARTRAPARSAKKTATARKAKKTGRKTTAVTKKKRTTAKKKAPAKRTTRKTARRR